MYNGMKSAGQFRLLTGLFTKNVDIFITKPDMFPKYKHHISNLYQNLILGKSIQNVAIQTFSWNKTYCLQFAQQKYHLNIMRFNIS